MHGVLLLDKPHGLSSNVALQRARHLLRAEKAGHTGTLDPEATGLLPLCFGEATKFSSWLLDAPKGYQATLQLGQTSSTGDAEGALTPGEGPLPQDLSVVQAVLDSLLGDQVQVPPMHSALKFQGRPLYDYARAGVEIERKPRQIVVHQLRLLDLNGSRLMVQAACSKGTYIRVLAEEIGRRLGCGAWLAGLRRNRTGGFDLTQAVTLDQLATEEESQRLTHLRAPEQLVIGLPILQLDSAQAHALCHGQTPAATPPQVALGQAHPILRVHDPLGRFLGLAGISDLTRVQAIRLMAENPQPPMK